MTDPKDKLFLDLSDNVELAEHLSRKSVGDVTTLTVTGKVQEVDSKMAVLAVEEVSATTGDDDDYGDKEATEESPASQLFRMDPKPEGL